MSDDNNKVDVQQKPPVDLNDPEVKAVMDKVRAVLARYGFGKDNHTPPTPSGEDE